MQVTPAFVPAPALPALGGAVNGIIPTGGVLGGAVAGARAGAFFGPKGAILGGIAGAIAAGLLLPLPTAPGTLPGTSDPFGPANGRPQNGTAEGVSDFSPSGQTGTNGGVCTVRGKIKCRRGYKCNDNFELSITRSFSYGPGGGKLRVDWGPPTSGTGCGPYGKIFIYEVKADGRLGLVYSNSANFNPAGDFVSVSLAPEYTPNGDPSPPPGLDGQTPLPDDFKPSPLPIKEPAPAPAPAPQPEPQPEPEPEPEPVRTPDEDDPDAPPVIVPPTRRPQPPEPETPPVIRPPQPGTKPQPLRVYPVPSTPDPGILPQPLPQPEPTTPQPVPNAPPVAPPGPSPEPVPVPLPTEPGQVPQPVPIPVPGFPQPGPDPAPGEPSPEPLPGTTPVPSPDPIPENTGPDGEIVPSPEPWPTPTDPGTHFPVPGGPGVGPGGTRPQLESLAQEIGRIEQKVANLQTGNGGGGLADLLPLLPLLLQFLEGDIPGTTYKLTGVCEVPDANGDQPETEFEVASAKNLGAVINRLDTIDQMLQQHLAWKTPICKPQITPQGDWRTISFISDEVSPYGSARLRKRFRYRSLTGGGLGSVIDHWKDFTWQAGPVCVQHADASWGTPQCWASSAAEGKRVIRHAAGEAGIDPDQDGRWVISGSDSPRYGVPGTMRVNTKGGYYWITARNGSDGSPIVGTVDTNP